MMYAKYTVVLKSLMDNPEMKSTLDKALSTYPLYKGKKDYDGIPTREQLNTKLLNHYKYREIGFETVGRFVDELEITMNEIMPYYNERLKTIEIMADLPNPFDNVDVIEQYDEQRNSKSTGKSDSETNTNNTNKTDTSGSSTMENSANSTTNESGKNVHSDTPQDSLNITGKDIDNVLYADGVTWDKKDSENDSTSSGTSTETGSAESESTGVSATVSNGESEEETTISHTYTKKGNQGVNTYAHDMNEFRTAIIDVVNEIINDKRVKDLFMVIY